MIERKFVAERMKEFRVEEFVRGHMKGVGLSDIKVQKTPLGEKIIIATSRPGLVVGRKGENIKELTKTLKKEFDFENPQIEIAEVENPDLNPNVIAEKIVDFLERFGTSRFKAIGHKVMTNVMDAKASGIEIVISGKIPSSRARAWRFYKGYLKKCGDTALTNVDVAYQTAKLKTGVVGVKVSIMANALGIADKLQQSTQEESEKKKEDPKKEESKEKESEKPKKSPKNKEDKKE